MPVPLLFPKVSLEETQGKIARWLVSEGEAVTSGQVVFEIETDKVGIEVEAPADGVLWGPAPAGETVSVGAAVAQILAPGERGEAVAVGTDAVPGTKAPGTGAGPAQAASPRHPGGGTERRPNPTPLARRIARDSGISLDALAGTGPGGRVQKADVLALLGGPGSGMAGAGTSSGTAYAPGPALNPPQRAPFQQAGPLAAHSDGAAPGLSGDADGPLNAVWLRRGTGLPLVMLHGFSADLGNWRGFLPGLPPDQGVLALDLPGHGRSSRTLPAGGLDGMAAAVEATLAGQGIAAAILVGHSFGGALATRIAARRVIDCRALCLFAPAGLGPGINGGFIAGILRGTSAHSLRPWLEELVRDPAVISEPFVQAVVAARADPGLSAAQAGFAAQMFPDMTQALSIRADLAGLAIPARIIFGRQDRILDFADTRALPGNVGLYALDGCGHLPHLEQTALCQRLLAELVRSAG